MNFVYSVALSTDGRTLAMSGTSGEVWIMDYILGKRLHKISLTDVSRVQKVQFSPCGEYLATASDDMRCRVYDKDTAVPYIVLPCETPVEHIEFNADRLVHFSHRQSCQPHTP